jgi:hypothetical protein
VGLHHRGLASSTSKLYCVVEMCSVRPDSKRSRTRLRLGPFPLWDEAFLFPVLVPEMALVQVRVTSHDISPYPLVNLAFSTVVLETEQSVERNDLYTGVTAHAWVGDVVGACLVRSFCWTPG